MSGKAAVENAVNGINRHAWSASSATVTDGKYACKTKLVRPLMEVANVEKKVPASGSTKRATA